MLQFSECRKDGGGQGCVQRRLLLTRGPVEVVAGAGGGGKEHRGNSGHVAIKERLSDG